MRNDPPTVFIVDDDPAIRRSTAMLLESDGLTSEQFGSADDFLDADTFDRAGCLVLDLHMPGINGLDLVERMHRRQVTLPIIVVSGTGTIPQAVTGMKLGIVDFLVKPANPDLLLAKVRGAIQLDAQLRTGAAALAEIRVRLAALTTREREALRLLVTGLSNKQVAAEMGISIKTVENHRSSIMQKSGALNVADLTRMSMLVNDAAG